MKDHVLFGWLPETKTYATSEFSISQANTYGESVANVMQSSQIDSSGWFHPPITEGPPARAEPAFQLPSTHVLRIDDDIAGEMRLSSFVILVLGLLKGLRLVPEAWAHFYRVPTRPHQLTDFYVTDDAVSRVLTLAIDFWRRSDHAVRRLAAGAFHWHSFGATYLHSFEVFSAQYTVLDTCWRIYQHETNAKSASHAARVENLAAVFGVPLPAWAIVHNGASDLSKLRNALLHEALWAGEPIGFAHPATYKNLHRDLHALNSRFLLALLGERGRYVTSEIDRNMRLLR